MYTGRDILKSAVQSAKRASKSDAYIDVGSNVRSPSGMEAVVTGIFWDECGVTVVALTIAGEEHSYDLFDLEVI